MSTAAFFCTQIALHAAAHLIPSRYSVNTLLAMLPIALSIMLVYGPAPEGPYTAEKLLRQIHLPMTVLVFFIVYRLSALRTLLPFSPPAQIDWDETIEVVHTTGRFPRPTTRTLRRRPWSAAAWAGIALAAGGYLTANALDTSKSGDWLARAVLSQYGALAAAACTPALGIAFLTYLGAELGPGRRAMVVTVPLYSLIRSYDTRGLLTLKQSSTMGMEMFGVPVEEVIFGYFISHVFLLTLSLIDHINTLLLLVPTLPPCVPDTIVRQIGLYWNVVKSAPEVDEFTLASIVKLQERLDTGEEYRFAPRSFRIAYLAIRDFYDVAIRLVREAGGEPDDVQENRRRTLAAIRLFITQAYDRKTPPLERVFTLCTIPHITPSEHSAFYLFAALIPRLVPIHPFLELCDGLMTETAFMAASDEAVAVRIGDPNFELEMYLPIVSQENLRTYLLAVFGSLASVHCYLSWSLLSYAKDSPTRPVDEIEWTESLHPRSKETSPDLDEKHASRAQTAQLARTMGYASGLIDVAGSATTEAREGRLYLPLSKFSSTSQLLGVLSGIPPPKTLILPLLDQAQEAYDEAYPLFRALSFRVGWDLKRALENDLAIAKALRSAYV